MNRCVIFDDGLCSGCNGKKCQYWKECQDDGKICEHTTKENIPLSVILAMPLILNAVFFTFLMMVI